MEQGDLSPQGRVKDQVPEQVPQKEFLRFLEADGKDEEDCLPRGKSSNCAPQDPPSSLSPRLLFFPLFLLPSLPLSPFSPTKDTKVLVMMASAAMVGGEGKGQGRGGREGWGGGGEGEGQLLADWKPFTSTHVSPGRHWWPAHSALVRV